MVGIAADYRFRFPKQVITNRPGVAAGNASNSVTREQESSGVSLGAPVCEESRRARHRDAFPLRRPGTGVQNIRSPAATHLYAGPAGRLRHQQGVARRPTRWPAALPRTEGPFPFFPNCRKGSAIPHSTESDLRFPAASPIGDKGMPRSHFGRGRLLQLRTLANGRHGQTNSPGVCPHHRE